MKIVSIEFKNHQVFGDFNFDFRIDSSVRDFSLLVGENGCGKTIFLEEFFKLIGNGIKLWNDGVDRKIVVELSEAEKQVLEIEFNLISFHYTEEGRKHWERIKAFDKDGKDITTQILPKIQSDDFGKILKGAYSTVEINFTAKEIDAVRATDIDIDKLPKSKSNTDLASEIAQLLVDIKAQDDAEWGIWGRANMGKNTSIPILNGKLDRFKKAYAKMFVGKELCDVRPEENKHKIFFKDTLKDIEFDISKLSSGEKQVVYRAGYLLKNLKNLNGGIVLIDEPELSLHPQWQIKYLDFLKDLFQDENGQIDIQFIIATHSPFILKGISRDDVGVFIFAKNKLGEITVQNAYDKGFGLFKWSPSWGEINYFAYGLPTMEFHDELYGSLHEKFISSALDVAEAKRRSHIGVFDLEILADNNPANQTKDWSELRGGSQQPSYKVTTSTFIRNKMHHPESQQSTSYMDADFIKSIDKMIALI